MIGRARHVLPVAALLLLGSSLLVACGNDDAGLTRAEVEEIVRAEMVTEQPPSEPAAPLIQADVDEAVSRSMADLPKPAPGLTRTEVEEIVRTAITETTQTQPGLTLDEIQRIARAAVAAILPKSAPADYTRFFVEGAIARYEMQGLEATLAYYSREESVDGQWYVFIIDENDLVIAHPDPQRLGLDVNGWVGTDVNGIQLRARYALVHRGGQMGFLRLPEP